MKRRQALSFLIWSALALSWITGCNPLDTTIDVSDFDQSCSTNDDCIVVVDGDVCPSCSCPDAAITTSAKSEYDDEVAQRVDTCESTDESLLGACEPCADTIPVCVSGVCEATLPVRSMAQAFDQACTEAADCVVVTEGNACQTCSCENAAIALSAKPAWDEARGEAVCGMSTQQPCAIDCASVEATCEQGQCGITTAE